MQAMASALCLNLRVMLAKSSLRPGYVTSGAVGLDGHPQERARGGDGTRRARGVAGVLRTVL